MVRFTLAILSLLAVTAARAQQAEPQTANDAAFGSIVTQGQYDGGLDTRGLALADRYLDHRSYPSPSGLWLHNSRLQVVGDTFGFGHNSTLAVLCANQGPNCDAGTQGSFWDFGYRQAYGQEDSGVLALLNTDGPPLVDRAAVAVVPGGASGHHRLVFKHPLPEATFAPRSSPPDGLRMHLQLVAMTNTCFMGYITSWDLAGYWVEVDNWSRGAGNSCGAPVQGGQSPASPPSGELTVSIGSVTSGVGLLYGVANTVDNHMGRGAEFGEFTLYNGRTPDIRFSSTDPTADEMDIGDGFGPKPFVDWGFMLGATTNKQHRYAAGTAMLANGDWYRGFVSADPAGDGAFIDMPRGGGTDEGASFRSYRTRGNVLVCSPPGQPVACELDHAGNFQLAGKLTTRAPIQLAPLPRQGVSPKAEDCTPGALAYQPGARNIAENARNGSGMPVFCNDRHTWVTLNNTPVTY